MLDKKQAKPNGSQTTSSFPQEPNPNGPGSTRIKVLRSPDLSKWSDQTHLRKFITAKAPKNDPKTSSSKDSQNVMPTKIVKAEEFSDTNSLKSKSTEAPKSYSTETRKHYPKTSSSPYGGLYDLAFKSESGRNPDYKTAFNLYTKAARKGHSLSQYRLARLYLNGLGTDRNYEEAMFWFLKAYQQGSIASAFYIGLMYKDGNAPEKSYEKAAEWFSKAAEENHPVAQFHLGCLYEQGLGVKKDIEKAKNLYLRSAEQGTHDALNSLGMMYKEGRGFDKDEKKAVKLFEEAVEAGSIEALFNLGKMYKHGLGTKQDDIKAFECFYQAADAGCINAFNNLSLMYLNGIGVEQNIPLATDWCLEAVQKNNLIAKENLKTIIWRYHVDKLSPKIVPKIYAILSEALLKDWSDFEQLEPNAQNKAIIDLVLPLVKRIYGKLLGESIVKNMLSGKQLNLNDLKQMIENPEYMNKKIIGSVSSIKSNNDKGKFNPREFVEDEEMSKRWYFFTRDEREIRKSMTKSIEIKGKHVNIKGSMRPRLG